MSFVCFVTHNGEPVCLPSSSCVITVRDGLACVYETGITDSVWRDVTALQEIDCAQNAIAWLGLGVDTEGNPPSKDQR